MNIKTQGFTLIEILVSLTLFAFILLGFDAMQLSAWRMNQSAYFLSTATHQMQGMGQRLQALGENNGLDRQITDWNAENQLVLPQGYGIVSGNYPNYQIELRWQEGGQKKQLQENINL